jgi:hypothetical protein
MNIFLIVVGLVLILINFIPKRNKANSFVDILKNEEDLSNDYDIELMAIRKDMAESILDLQSEIAELREIINKTNKNNNEYDIKKMDKTNDIVEEMEDYSPLVNEINYNNSNIEEKTTKTDIIRKMISEGHSDDDICEELNIGKGEVLLIRGLYK